MAQKKTEKSKPALVVVHHSKGEDHEVVGNLRVMIMQDEEMWFAQSLEIDYAAAGTSVEDVKKRFEKGLAATIAEHIEMYGNLQKFFRPSPLEVWKEFFEMPSVRREQYSFHLSTIAAPQIVQNTSPFSGIAYIEKEAVMA